VIERDQDAVGDGDDRAFGAAAAGQALEAGREVGLFAQLSEVWAKISNSLPA